MRVLEILHGTIVDGPGLRTSIYFAGCKHHCPGCHNPSSWDFTGGHEMSVDEIFAKIKTNGFNVTFSGGDPLYQNIYELISLAKKIKGIGLDLWLYTGFTIEEVLDLKIYDELLKYVDVIVDGRFEIKNMDKSLLFRGSSNQRILKLLHDEDGNKIYYEILKIEN